MTIEDLCAAIKGCLPVLENARKDKDGEIDHSLVEEFQKRLTVELNDAAQKKSNGYKWGKEIKVTGRHEKDSIDILGKARKWPSWIIEIDATRSDQVSQKFLSRLALMGLKNPVQYVALLYPDTRNGKKACEKYLRYGNDILKKVNEDSSIIGVFVEPDILEIEVQQFGKRDHFEVKNKENEECKECSSMGEAAAEAVKMYMKSRPASYANLKRKWGKYVLDNKGDSRYKSINERTSDGIMVHTYSQFRQYGLCSYWSDFEKLCKKNGIKVSKMRKLYTGGTHPYTYIV